MIPQIFLICFVPWCDDAVVLANLPTFDICRKNVNTALAFHAEAHKIYGAGAYSDAVWRRWQLWDCLTAVANADDKFAQLQKHRQRCRNIDHSREDSVYAPTPFVIPFPPPVPVLTVPGNYIR
jgi:hypothetical protein